MNIQNIDLKLLVFLDALLDEKSVSRAHSCSSYNCFKPVKANLFTTGNIRLG